MIEVVEIVERSKTELVISVSVVLGIGGTVFCVINIEFDGKGGEAAKVTELVDTSCFNGVLSRFRIFRS